MATLPPCCIVSGKMPGVSIATALKAKAAPTPMPISVNMFKRRVTTERQPRCNNGQPAHPTTGVASANCIQREALPPTQGCLPRGGIK